MSQYQNDVKQIAELRSTKAGAWNAINPQYAARMKAQNRFKTGLDIAKYTAAIMRKDMQEYDADSSFNTWFKDLNRDMTDLHMNAIEVYDKRNGDRTTSPLFVNNELVLNISSKY